LDQKVKVTPLKIDFTGVLQCSRKILKCGRNTIKGVILALISMTARISLKWKHSFLDSAEVCLGETFQTIRDTNKAPTSILTAIFQMDLGLLVTLSVLPTLVLEENQTNHKMSSVATQRRALLHSGESNRKEVTAP